MWLTMPGIPAGLPVKPLPRRRDDMRCWLGLWQEDLIEAEVDRDGHWRRITREEEWFWEDSNERGA